MGYQKMVFFIIPFISDKLGLSSVRNVILCTRLVLGLFSVAPLFVINEISTELYVQ